MNKRPVDDVVSLIHDPRFGIIFTNGDAWRIQRKNFVSLLRNMVARWLKPDYKIVCVWLYGLLDYGSATLRCKILSLPFLET